MHHPVVIDSYKKIKNIWEYSAVMLTTYIPFLYWRRKFKEQMQKRNETERSCKCTQLKFNFVEN